MCQFCSSIFNLILAGSRLDSYSTMTTPTLDYDLIKSYGPSSDCIYTLLILQFYIFSNLVHRLNCLTKSIVFIMESQCRHLDMM